jgi:hypothetical protein
MTAVEDVFFDGKCDVFIEGYCYDDSKGYPQIYPWKPYSKLDNAQRDYERKLIVQYEAELAALRKHSISAAELEAAYQEGVNSV